MLTGIEKEKKAEVNGTSAAEKPESVEGQESEDRAEAATAEADGENRTEVKSIDGKSEKNVRAPKS